MTNVDVQSDVNEDDAALGERVARLTAQWRPGASVSALQPLLGGHSSRTYLARADPPGAEPLVIKVAPAGVPPTRNRDVLRQARAMNAIGAGAGVAVPEVLFEDPGAPVAVPPLFAMSFVSGECVEPALDVLTPDALPTPSDVRSRALVAARMLGALHSLDPVAIGLGDEAPMSLEQEIDRWRQLLATIDDAALIEGSAAVEQALRRTAPDRTRACLLHGDYRLGNTLCAGGDVLAVIDWEIWSVGDPRIDLAWFLLTTQPDVHPSALRGGVGFPPIEELLAAYGSDIPTVELNWFQALQLYKMAAASALIAKNLQRRGTDPDTLARTRESIPKMIAGATRLLG